MLLGINYFFKLKMYAKIKQYAEVNFKTKTIYY